MKAVVKAKPGVGIDVMDMPKPKIKPNEALVEIKACGICGSDLGLYEWIEEHRYRRGRPIELPRIIGHEAGGVVVEVGKDVKTLKPGDRVASDSWGGCGQCYWCRRGHFNMCLEGNNIGSLTDGGMAPYCAIPFFTLYKIPDSMTYEEAAIVEPLGVAVRGFETLVDFKLGDDVAIFGPGSIGLLEAMVMRAAGAGKIIIIGLSVDEKRMAMARQLGFTTINAEKQPARDAVLSMTDGMGVDVCFDATLAGIPGQAIKLLKQEGQLVCTAGVEGTATFESKDFRRGEIIINTHRARNPSSVFSAVKLIANGRVDVKPLVTHKFKIEDAVTAFKTLLSREGMKVMIVP